MWLTGRVLPSNVGLLARPSLILFSQSPMKNIAFLTLLLTTGLITACTTQEKKDIKELENMPGVTCVTNVQGQTHCGPDSLSATEQN